MDGITGVLKDLFDTVKNIFSSIGEILNYINPLSEKFFLWIAFIPEDGYFENYSNKYQTLIKEKFAVVYQLRDTIEAFKTAVESNAMGKEFSITADLSKYGIGEVEVVNGKAIHTYGEKLKFWIGGLMIFLTSAWLFRKVSGLIGEGK